LLARNPRQSRAELLDRADSDRQQSLSDILPAWSTSRAASRRGNDPRYWEFSATEEAILAVLREAAIRAIAPSGFRLNIQSRSRGPGEGNLGKIG
jgi:hypothetical protein